MLESGARRGIRPIPTTPPMITLPAIPAAPPPATRVCTGMDASWYPSLLNTATNSDFRFTSTVHGVVHV
jgi:hypothetical protein